LSRNVRRHWVYGDAVKEACRPNVERFPSLHAEGASQSDQDSTSSGRKERRPILCDGKRLWIQRNLYDFLVRLRELGKFRPLWIDALCIDQDESNPEVKAEKMRQLWMMGRIYSSADVVLVWVGEYAGVSTSLPRYLDGQARLDQYDYKPYTSEHDVIERIKQEASLQTATIAMFGVGVQIHNPDERGENEPITVRSSKIVRYFHFFKTVASASLQVLSMLEAVTRLLTRDYFQRAWVVQETTLVKQLVFFI
jgi:hypothetical protein